MSKLEDANEARAVAVRSPPTSAGGLPALGAAMSHLLSGSGLMRGSRALLQMNQTAGFDCPGCAWPESKSERSSFEFCENGAKAIALEANPRRVDAEFFAAHSVAELRERSEHWLGQQGRLSEPMVLEAGATHYTPISWDDAFRRVAAALQALPSPDQAVFYTSGRTSNEAAYLYQLFVRLYGTNNLPDCSNLCHESSGYALKQSIGVGKGTVQLEDFDVADVILVIGQNPGTNHPRMMTTLQRAARRGCKIISINPMPEVALARFVHPQAPWESLGRGTVVAAQHLAVRGGGDIALFKGVMKHLLALNRVDPNLGVDRAFIAAHTDGFAELEADLEQASWADLTRLSGIAQPLIKELAESLARTNKIIACWAMGLTQHAHAVDNIHAVSNLMLMRGALGHPGAGLCPVRGHSNVQGDRTMGITSSPASPLLDGLAARYGFSPAMTPGYDTVSAIEAMHAGKVSVFVSLGGNLVSAAPDTARTAIGLGNCDWTVQISTLLNRSHLVTGKQALLLPCLARSDADPQTTGLQFVTVEDSMSTVHRSRGTLRPVSEQLLSEPAIVARLAAATLPPRGTTPWLAWADNYDAIRDEISNVVPGFDEFNQRVRAEHGFVLDNPARRLEFNVAGGRAQFFVPSVPDRQLAAGEFLLMTIRSHDQYNTTVYGLDDRYRGISGGRRVVLLNPADIAAQQLSAGDLVHVSSRFEGEVRRIEHFRVVPYDVPPGTAACYFPEANPLIALGDFAVGSRTPASKSVCVTLERAAGEAPPALSA